MLKLETPVQYLKGVGPKMAAKLKKLGIEKINDLIFYFPRDWNDLSVTVPIKSLRIGTQNNIKAKITDIRNEKTFKKRINLTTATLEDENGDQINAVWFNQPFLEKALSKNKILIFSGKTDWDFKTKKKVLSSPSIELEAKIYPIYSETEGLNSKYIRKLMSNVFGENILPEDYLPSGIKSKEDLVDFKTAIHNVHFPNNSKDLISAKKRLAFDEIFILILKTLIKRKEIELSNSFKMKIYKNELMQFVKNLTYSLTNAQRKSSWEIIQDLTKNHPMNRMLEGDVGSGKTVVGVMAALNSVLNGSRVVWMAPTEILAIQHYENVRKLLGNFNISISLITSSKLELSQKKDDKKIEKEKLKKIALSNDIIIGTHALIEDDVRVDNLGLVIIDEQHRFGVKQRAALREKNIDTVPHFLSMTATPIPRSLALSIYGDLDISMLDEMPASRKKIVTKIVEPINRNETYKFVSSELSRGHQAFVICPLIKESEKAQLKSGKLFDLEKKTVLNEYKRLSESIFKNFQVSFLHGKMKPKEKEKIMNDFKDKKIDVLVSTSVIEVGVDIPNATVMMIENADNFGLSQLHQFRGRVGRGSNKSYCFLFTSSMSGNRRLRAIEECSDGFKLAEKDLEIRGPGELTGINQHGIPDLKMASLTDIILINKAKVNAENILKNNLENYPLLISKLNERSYIKHME